ncbi:MAG TPA: ABC transporter substrate-binding protein [Symbiobacteriaceae bacterium]|nr:ABC transporter substrate-binding protein [Symbiobacteriaceae bacterium]
MIKRLWILAIALALLAAAGCSPGSGRRAQPAPTVLRLGYFANLTHAQAVLGLADGSLERAAGVPIRPKLFTAGPVAITALLAGEIDVLYVGPSPAVTGYIRSQGAALRIVAGAASGGAVFVVRPGVDPAHLDGAHLASPGIANTQDLSLRYVLEQQGLKPREKGGNVAITPVAPAEMLGLFARGQLDGAWVAEPWGARLVAETGARVAIDERDLWPDRRFPTTVVVASTAYLKANPAAVQGLLRAHADLTQFLREHPDAARGRLQSALAALQGKALPDAVMADAFGRVEYLLDPLPGAVQMQAQRAYDLGYLGARRPDLSGLFDLTLLEGVKP